MVVCKKVKGEVDYNDREFGEVQTIGIEGIERDLWLNTIQTHKQEGRRRPLMPKTQLIIRKVFEGRVARNNGDFAEIEMIGTEGIEKNLWLETIQAHCEDTNDTTEGFQRRFPVGTWVNICISTTITNESGHASAAPTTTSKD